MMTMTMVMVIMMMEIPGARGSFKSIRKAYGDTGSMHSTNGMVAGYRNYTRGLASQMC